MYLNFRNISKLSLLLIGTLVGVSSVKIKSGKVTTTPTTILSPNSLQPKFTPSQQIVTDLLTPAFVKSQVSQNTNSRTKGSGKVRQNKKGKQHVGVVMGLPSTNGQEDMNVSYSHSTSITTAWNLEHPLIPGDSDSWNINSNFSGDTIMADRKGSVPSEISSGGLKFTFSTPNSADSTWVGLRKTDSPGGHQTSMAGNLGLDMNLGTHPMHYTPSPESVNPNRILYIPETIDDDDDDDDLDYDDSGSDEHEQPKKKSKRKDKTKKSRNQKSSRKDLNFNSTDDTTDAKINKMEELVRSLSKNVDVMRQNTQVISKGFNILSTRFNKLTSDQDELNLKLDKKFVLVEEGIIRMQKEVGKKLKEMEAKEDKNVKSLKKSDHELLETQLANGQEHKKWMETLSGKVVNFKSEFDKESKVLAEMVKALAEIQKKEKGKLDTLGKNLNAELGKLREKLAANNLDDVEVKEREQKFQERAGHDSHLLKKVEHLESNLKSTQSSMKNDSDLFKRELGDLSKYVEDKLKRLDESLQEQNMAHNMAHEHISLKMEDLSSTSTSSSTKHTIFGRGDDAAVQEMIETSPIYPLVLDRLTRLEHNYTKIQERSKIIGEKVESMEDTDLSILSRIADLRNSQALEINWTKSEISKISQNLNETLEKVREIGEVRLAKSKRKDPELPAHPHQPLLQLKMDEQDNMLMEVGGLSMADPTLEPPRTEPAPQSLLRTTIYYNSEGNGVGLPSSGLDSNLNSADRGGLGQGQIQGQGQGQGQLSDRMESVEENIAELWRTQTESKTVSENVQELIRDLQENQVKSQKNSQIQLKHFEDATKLLRDMLRNSTYKINSIQRHMEGLEEQIKSKMVTDRRGQSAEDDPSEMETTTLVDEEVSGRVKTVSHPPLMQEDVNLLREEIQSVRDIVESLLSSNKNVTKAQEFFLFKLLEMDQEHKKDNRTLGENLFSLRNETEDNFLEISRSEDRLNKVVQQFTITDAEQVKIREELWNIKDRLNGLEENYVNLWKTNKKFFTELEQVVNSVDNINLVHGSELQNLSMDLGLSKDKLENVTKTWRHLDNRLSNVELLMDMEVGTQNEPNTSELGKLKQRLSNTEKDVSELWKSSEILSFQQQVMAENFKFLEATHENYSGAASADRGSTKKDTFELMSLFQNLTKRVTTVEKITNPLYETKTINFMIPDWAATSASESGLRDEFLEYHLGGDLKKYGHRSSWKTYLSLNGTHLSIFNILLKADSPMFNEFEVQVLDGDGRVFTTAGPEQHLYKKRGDSFSVSNIISRQTLENPKFGLLSRNTLKLKVKVRVYPKYQLDEVEDSTKTPSEKQLVLWEVRGLARKLDEVAKSPDLFQELNITKEFVAGHSWSGFSLWRASFLIKSINRQEYLGLSLELIQRDGDWKELEASYNVTMLDAHSRIAKEFSISPNDFISVSARHSYFMLVKDAEDILSRGDSLTFRIYFDLQAKRKAYDVEVIG